VSFGHFRRSKFVGKEKEEFLTGCGYFALFLIHEKLKTMVINKTK
jgi:hypothetical protein